MGPGRLQWVRGCWSIEIALVIDLLESLLSGRHGVFSGVLVLRERRLIWERAENGALGGS